MAFSIEWWGTAAFRINYRGWQLLLDPYFSRNPYARPALQLSPSEAARGASLALVSHGHFDHVWDIPALLSENSALHVVAPQSPAARLRLRLQDPAQLKRVHEMSEGEVDLSETGAPSDVRIRMLPSQHVHFDLPLIGKSLWGALWSPARLYLSPRLLSEYPCGDTVSYVIDLGGYKIQFLGSAGPTAEMLSSWKSNGAVNCLLLPLQGNSKICEIGARIVEALQPAIVIPQHHDNFYPPVSQSIDISRFRKLVAERAPKTTIIEIEPGQKHEFR